MEFRCHDHRQDRQRGRKDFIVRVRKKGYQRAGYRWTASPHYCALLLAEEMYFQTSAWSCVLSPLGTCILSDFAFSFLCSRRGISQCRCSLKPLSVTPVTLWYWWPTWRHSRNRPEFQYLQFTKTSVLKSSKWCLNHFVISSSLPKIPAEQQKVLGWGSNVLKIEHILHTHHHPVWQYSIPRVSFSGRA